jgi:hypothetical protein
MEKNGSAAVEGRTRTVESSVCKAPGRCSSERFERRARMSRWTGPSASARLATSDLADHLIDPPGVGARNGVTHAGGATHAR